MADREQPFDCGTFEHGRPFPFEQRDASRIDFSSVKRIDPSQSTFPARPINKKVTSAEDLMYLAATSDGN
jgi:hypothetical protein